MPKYKIGDKVYDYRWRALGKAHPTKVVAVMPKRWWQHQMYLVEYSDFPVVAKEKHLMPATPNHKEEKTG